MFCPKVFLFMHHINKSVFSFATEFDQCFFKTDVIKFCPQVVDTINQLSLRTNKLELVFKLKEVSCCMICFSNSTCYYASFQNQQDELFQNKIVSLRFARTKWKLSLQHQMDSRDRKKGIWQRRHGCFEKTK